MPIQLHQVFKREFLLILTRSEAFFSYVNFHTMRVLPGCYVLLFGLGDVNLGLLLPLLAFL